MNIFVLDENPRIAAQFHNDKHVVKMILESAQLLSNAYYVDTKLDTKVNLTKFPRKEGFYKRTHWNHPCSKWTRSSLDNWKWLLQLALELCKEYTFRYNKTHKTEQILNWMSKNNPNIKENGFSTFVKAMPKYISDVVEDPILAYKMYYIIDKKHLAKWKNREMPEWYESL